MAAFPKGSGVRFYGDPIAVITQASAILSTAFSAGTLLPITQDITDVAELADVVLDIQFATAPAANAVVYLYRRDKNISGANHAPVPSAAFRGLNLGPIKLSPVGTRQYLKLNGITLSKDQEFYIENTSGKDTTGTTVLTVTPYTYGPRA